MEKYVGAGSMRDTERNRWAFEILIELGLAKRLPKKASLARRKAQKELAWKTLINMIYAELLAHEEEERKSVAKYKGEFTSVRSMQDVKKKVSALLLWQTREIGEQIRQFFHKRILGSGRRNPINFQARQDFYERVLTGLMDRLHNE